MKRKDSKKSLPISCEEKEVAKVLILLTCKALTKVYGKKKIKLIESNMFHFIIYQVIKENSAVKLTNGWYIHGPYIPAVDDALIEMGMMESKYHQITGSEGGHIMDKLVIFEDENPNDMVS